MTINEYVDTIRNTLLREDETQKYHPNLVKMHCNFVWQQILHDAFSKATSYLDFYAKEFLNVTVSQDANNRYYSLFPTPILQLPERQEGVRHITTAQGDEIEFVPTSEKNFRLFSGMEGDNIQASRITYFVQYDRAVFVRNMTAAIASQGVRMKLVIPFNEYSGTEELPVPSGKSEMFIESVLNRLRAIPPVDLSTKND